jgi:hypothetical protein
MVKFREEIFEVPPKLDGRNVAVKKQAKPLSLKLSNPNRAAKRFSVGFGHRVHHANRHLPPSYRIPSVPNQKPKFEARNPKQSTVKISQNPRKSKTLIRALPFLII